MLGLIAVALLAANLPNAVVLKPVAAMLSAPRDDAAVVSQAIYASNVGVIERNAGWARVRTVDGYLGWMPEAALQVAPPYAAGGRVAEVFSLFAHLYREADVTKHQPLLTVPFETRLEVAAGEEPDGRWLQVRLPDGAAAWVQRGDLAFSPKPMSAAEAVAFSQRFLDLPYTWGGTSSYGYDCSGFVQMLGRRRGLLMPRDSQPQADWNGSAPIRREELQPGDLVYFGASDKKITHTGMYLGGGRFISATTWQSPMVRIDSLEDQHWAGLLVACRRLK